MKPTITAFADSPDGGQGLARDMRVRWALEEAGQDYDVVLVPWAEFKEPEHRARQPFGQIPTYECGDVALFESGAIVLHIAEMHPGTLLPADPAGRARAITWMFNAVSTMEQPIVDHEMAALFDRDKPWFHDRLPEVDALVRTRLTDLAAYLGEREWLEGEFTAGDLMMIEVLLRLEGDVVGEFPALTAYIDRGRARPAFKRAFAAQRAVADAAKR